MLTAYPRRRSALLGAISATAAVALVTVAVASHHDGRAAPGAGGIVTDPASSPSSVTGTITGQEQAVAVDIAHREANTTRPGPDGAPIRALADADMSRWPDNVDSVGALTTSESVAMQLIDPEGAQKAASPDVDVVVVQMTGHFSIPIPHANPNVPDYQSATTMTIVVDAASGDELSFRAELDPKQVVPLPSPLTPLFQR